MAVPIGLAPVAQAKDGVGRPDTSDQRPSEVKEVEGLGAKKARAQVARDTKANNAQADRARKEQRTAWPTKGSASLTVDKAGGAKPGGLPLTVRPADGKGALPKGTDLRFTVLGADAADAAGITGVLFTVDTDRSGRAEVSVDYGGFAGAIGGGWAQRLRLVQLPACAQDTPEKADCRKQTPLSSRNDVGAQTVTAPLSLTADGGITTQLGTSASASASTATVLALTATGTGEGQSPDGSGDYSATDLSPSASWESGGSSGSFNWNYDFTLPSAAAGPTPSLSLAYSSGTVDGRNAATNNQGSSVGEGFALSESYIERFYGGCDDDGHDGIHDQCWKYDNARLVLNGTSSLLVKDDDTGKWRLENDDDSLVTRSTGADNGDNDGEYWTVVTGQGTKYVFGLNKLAGADTQRTNSTWTVPVFGDDSGEPGYDKGDSFADRSLQQAWRWNLDYVEDTSGNASTYWYAKETNHYKKNKADTANASYTRGGYLKEITYGLRKGELFTDDADAKVTFGYAERCTAADCSELTADTADNWPDVPFDAICSSGDEDCLAVGPSFFSRKRMTSVDTFSWNASTSSYDAVDSWTFTQRYLDGGDIGDTSDQVLTLTSLRRTGKTGTDIEMNPVSFTYQMRPNRVDGTDDILPLTRPRISTVTSETGAITTVTLSSPECVRSEVLGAAEDTNTRSCYPLYWNINGAENASVDWFHKYRVLAVTESDPTGQNEAVENAYSYSGAAWNYSDDPFVPKAERTWSDWRGYRKVTVYKGALDTTRSKSVSLYMQGMDGDKLKDGSTRSVSVAPLTEPALGLSTLKDSDQYAGQLREKVTYDGSTPVSATSSQPWSKETARQSVPGAGDQVAYFVRTKTETTHTFLTAPKTWRDRTVEKTYDSHGMVVTAEDRGDDATTGDETCARTWYARNEDTGLTSTVSRERTVSAMCDVTDADLDLPASATKRGDVLSDVATAYDGAAWSTAMKPTTGLKTWTGRAKSYTTTIPAWQTTDTTAYDTLGRVTSVTDALERTTTTAYTPSESGPLTKKVVTNPKGYRTTTFIDPLRGLDLRVYDANLKKTELSYDALGRLTAVWRPNRNRAAGYSATQKFAYHLSATEPSWQSSSSLKADGETYNTTYTLYDSLLRTLQEQAPSPKGGRVLTDTRYDSRGLAYETYEEIFDTTAGPNSTYTRAEYGEAPKQTETVFDGAERVVSSELLVYGESKWTTTTSHTGDSTATSAQQGGSAVRTITDARGREVERREYAGTSPADAEFGSGPGATHSDTTFTYTLDDKERVVTGPDGSAWTYGFDLFGRKTSADDPDKGTSTMGYDAADQLVKSTDSRGQSVLTAYDELGRTTGTWDGVKDDAHQLTAYTYDTVLKGKPTANIRYVGGKNGTAYTKTVTAYDTLDRPTETTLTLPDDDPLVEAGAPATIPFSSSYRLDGTLRNNKEPALGGLPSEVLDYGYTSLGQVTSITGSTGYLLDADYSALGRAQQYTLGTLNTEEAKKVYVTNTYEEGTGRMTRSRVTDQTHPYALMELNYTFDDAGNVTAIADPTTLGGASAAETQCFTYDGHRRLTSAWTPASQQCSDDADADSLSGPAPYWTDYTYNEAGQRTAETQHAQTGATTTTYCYEDDRPHTVTGTSDSADCTTPDDAYSYDASGNTTGRPGATASQSLTWSPEGRLASLTEDEKSTDYLYDADGTLLIRSTEGGERILYTGNTELHLRADGTTWAQRSYSSGSLTIAVRSNESGSNELNYLAGDQQGTQSLAVSADSAQTFTKRRMTPFGDTRGSNTGGAWPDDKGFLGKTTDSTTGLTHLDAREYDPKIGQFISADPKLTTTQAQSLNGYAYANNNPATFTDPTGEMVPECNEPQKYGITCRGGIPVSTGSGGGSGNSNGGGNSSSGGNSSGSGSTGGGGVVYGPPSCGVPPLAACGGPVYGPPSPPPLLMGPDPAPLLSFSANCGIESDWNYLCNASNGLMTSGSYLYEGFNRAGIETTKAAKNMRAHPDPKMRSQAGKTLRSLQTHPGVQRVASAGRGSTMMWAGRVTLWGGIAATGYSNYQSTGGDVPLTAVETAVDTAVVIGATKVGATLGATIGTAIAPGVGTVIGGAIGGAAGAVSGILMTGPVNNGISRIWKGAKGWFD
ncbi:RHS repeat domain-containing protein [Streptomyces sp. AC1-42W]|uniref:RHS repeat domain-containing protein n=1 Tax=Streptomyces sp. AC1-42W TaxID=2218666 RepID=UPI000DAC2172|nr:RHS repeat-associated core domain-containing protein [Streptomyces sp. AC1-42W]PZT78166.1 RHS repeat-associated core domain-containing protein [Streptomyces sp. AC1-42W]